METPAHGKLDLNEARRESKMATARLEHAILQTVINYTANEEHLTREQIVMALVNVAGYWTQKTITSNLAKKIREMTDS
jgi:hypothetical protein